MPIRISDAIGVSHAKLDTQGAFDGFIDIDSHFHIHPKLLLNPIVPELAESKARFENYFCDVISLLNSANKAVPEDILFRRATNKLIIKEISIAALGFAKEGTTGHAIGPKLALQICETAFQIVKAGIKDTVIFELAGLFEEGIGADLISDMCLSIILPDILAFNDRISKRLNLSKVFTKVGSIIHDLPQRKDGKAVLLLPSEILSPMPIALTWYDISTVVDYNNEIRREINKNIGKTWGKASRQLSKNEIKSTLLQNPDLLKDLIAQYKNNPLSKYDYINDPLGKFIWFDVSKDYAKKFPLPLESFNPSDHDSVLKTVIDICQHFKQLIESNGLFKLFYNQDKKLRPEKFPQLLFYGIADAYCNANNLDLSAEPNAGRGAVDFKVSKGYNSRMNVEVKYSKHGNLVSAFETQLLTYDKAEKTFESIYLVIDTGKSSAKLKKLQQLRNDRIVAGKRAPLIIIIDGTYQYSASKLF
jgi:hypothetical protein